MSSPVDLIHTCNEKKRKAVTPTRSREENSTTQKRREDDNYRLENNQQTCYVHARMRHMTTVCAKSVRAWALRVMCHYEALPVAKARPARAHPLPRGRFPDPLRHTSTPTRPGTAMLAAVARSSLWHPAGSKLCGRDTKTCARCRVSSSAQRLGQVRKVAAKSMKARLKVVFRTKNWRSSTETSQRRAMWIETVLFPL